MKHNPSGFTLIEMAIALAVTSLLLGATLKGGELIDSARAKNISLDFRNVPLYISGYQDEFKTLPGDDANLANHLPGATPCSPPAAGMCVIGNGVIDGKWSNTTVASESYLFWQHIRLAGLTDGPTDTSSGDYIPRNEFGGQIGITSISPIIGLKGKYIVCSDAIPGKFAKRIDVGLDDGNTATGYMQVVDAGTTTPSNPTQTANIVDDNRYLVCMIV
ncbi:MAG TPA: prepilin-type N-terminal cleavage/methylation domain-containing protein [Gallionella sp.]|nr:prepilin-type N-terminal cleavage/methylation domain-containing protein [Gallionella sp.]